VSSRSGAVELAAELSELADRVSSYTYRGHIGSRALVRLLRKTKTKHRLSTYTDMARKLNALIGEPSQRLGEGDPDYE
jgi:hypothetical protein